MDVNQIEIIVKMQKSRGAVGGKGVVGDGVGCRGWDRGKGVLRM